MSKEMCVGVTSSPADDQDEQDDLGTDGVSNLRVFVHVCGVDVVSSFGELWQTRKTSIERWHDDG